jgi:hypothetical protein
MTVLVGADPEVFVRDKQGRFRSAHGLIPGTKKEPYKVKDGAVQVDGLALEFNIDPASTREQFVHNIGSVMGQLAAMVPDYELVIQPSVRFNGNHLRAQPEEALELGCEPDYDAYKEKENPRPNNKTTLRTGAGHVHIGFTEGADPQDPEHIQRCITLVKHLDAFLGLPSLSWDNDTLRRTLYGKAGAFRPKEYGVEYRTLSNAWLRDPRLVGYVFDQVQACVEWLKAGNRLPVEDRKTPNYLNSALHVVWKSDGIFGPASYVRHRIPKFVMPPEIPLLLMR